MSQPSTIGRYDIAHGNVKTSLPDILAPYRQPDVRDDELMPSEGIVNPAWRNLIHNLEKLGSDEIEARSQELTRILRENGVTYNNYNDPQGTNRPWELDPIPLIISQKEWIYLEQGIKQRAELLDIILKDIYGPRNLIRSGLIPLEMIYNHPGFLRECDQIVYPGKYQLPVYAVDIVRAPDGMPWVLNDRTQAPSGTGYALENRTSMSRVLPDLFKDLEVRKLSVFFHEFREMLAAAAPDKRLNPRIVVLTPGPRNETYFEHAYLATNMGFTLVQGDDLTVRGDFIYIKSLRGLERVDVILRRVDDSFCDPLELREDSKLGIPGLMNVIRKGNVVVTNPLGSSVLENPALMAFLPGICRKLTGKELLLPSVATWWCGQKNELEYVISHIDQLIIKRVYRINNQDSVLGSLLTKSEKELLIAQIKSQPYLYVGQEQVNFTTIPSLIQKQLEPRFSTLRCYAVGTSHGYKLMPGGLTRSSPEKGLFIISNQAGGISKDTWVLGAESHNEQPFSRTNIFDTEAGHAESLPSRTAENLFWMGRYAERSLYTARLMRTVLKFITEDQRFNNKSEIECRYNLFRSLTHITMTYPGFVGNGSNAKLNQPEKELKAIILDNDKVGSLSYSLQCMIRACYTLRDQLAMDTWRIIDTMEDNWKHLQQAGTPNLRLIQSSLDQLITSLVAFMGLNNESMIRESSWLIMDIGRRIELGLMITSMVRATLVYKLDQSSESSIQESVLYSNESLITHKHRYRSHLQLNTVLDLLLMDDMNPRSLIFQMERLRKNIEKIPRKKVFLQLNNDQKHIMEALTKLRLTDTVALSHSTNKFIRKELDTHMADLSKLMSEISVDISQQYFSHSIMPQQLGKNILNV